MPSTGAPGVDSSAAGSDATVAATSLASWGALARAAHAALCMIPTARDSRLLQEPLLRELARAAGRAAPAAPDQAISTSARDLVESTLVGLREPAGARPYDVERSQGLRRRVLRSVVVAVDEAAGMARRPGSDELLAVAGALRAGRLAGDLLAGDLLAGDVAAS